MSIKEEVRLEDKNKNYSIELINHLKGNSLNAKMKQLVDLVEKVNQEGLLEYQADICDLMLYGTMNLEDILNNGLREWFLITLPEEWSKRFVEMFLQLEEHFVIYDIQQNESLPIQEQYFYKKSVLDYIMAVFYNYEDFDWIDYLIHLDTMKYMIYSPKEFVILEGLTLEIKEDNQRVIQLIKDFIHSNPDNAGVGWKQISHLLCRCRNKELCQEMIQSIFESELFKLETITWTSDLEQIATLIKLIKIVDDKTQKDKLLELAATAAPEIREHIIWGLLSLDQEEDRKILFLYTEDSNKRVRDIAREKLGKELPHQEDRLNQLYNPSDYPIFEIEYSNSGILESFSNISIERLVEVWDVFVSFVKKNEEYTYYTNSDEDGSRKEMKLEEAYEWHREYSDSEEVIKNYILQEQIAEMINFHNISILELIKIEYFLSLQSQRNRTLKYFSWVRKLVNDDFGTNGIYSFRNQVKEKPYGPLVGDIIGKYVNFIDIEGSFQSTYHILVDFMEKHKEKTFFTTLVEETQYNRFKTNSTVLGMAEVSFFIWLKQRSHTTVDNFKQSVILSYKLGELNNQRVGGLSIEDIAKAVELGILSENELYRSVLQKSVKQNTNIYQRRIKEIKRKSLNKKYLQLDKVVQDIEKVLLKGES